MSLTVFNKVRAKVFAIITFLATALFSIAHAEMAFNFQEPVTDIAHEIYNLHLIVTYIIIVIGVLVFGVMIYSIIYHRKSKGYKAATFHSNLTVELIWTAIPFLIIVGIAIPATSTLLRIKDTTSPDMTVKVVGYQWKWSYDYLDDNVFFYSTLTTPPEQIGSLLGGYGGEDTNVTERNDNYLLEVDNPLVVPVNTKVRILLTAADVIHSWTVPQLGVKQDAIPGIIRDTWFSANREGTYRGQCVELCGKNHGFMPVVVEVVSRDAYDAWLAERGGGVVDLDNPVAVGDVVASAPVKTVTGPAEWTHDEVFSFGESIYNTQCAACHQKNGEGLLPTFPALKASPIATGPAEAHIDTVLQGIATTTMASFAHLSDTEIAAIIHYERNAWGNNVGDLVTPDDVSARR